MARFFISDGKSPDVVDAMKPQYVAPVVLWLCHEDCKDSGGVVECGGGYVAKGT